MTLCAIGIILDGRHKIGARLQGRNNLEKETASHSSLPKVRISHLGNTAHSHTPGQGCGEHMSRIVSWERLETPAD